MRALLNDRRLLLPLLLTAVAIAVGSLLIVLLAGDSAESGPAAGSSSQRAVSGALTIDISDFKYQPETATVKVGSKITWVNNDAAPHTSTAKGEFDTGNLSKGDKSTVSFKTAGTYAYICELHPFMKATVIVE